MVEAGSSFQPESTEDDSGLDTRKKKRDKATSLFKSFGLTRASDNHDATEALDQQKHSPIIFDLAGLLTGKSTEKTLLQSEFKEDEVNKSKESVIVVDNTIDDEKILFAEQSTEQINDIINTTEQYDTTFASEEKVETNVPNTENDSVHSVSGLGETLIDDRHSSLKWFHYMRRNSSLSANPKYPGKTSVKSAQRTINVSNRTGTFHSASSHLQSLLLPDTDRGTNSNTNIYPRSSEYESTHTHALLAAVLSGAILLEHMYGKRQDKRLEMRTRRTLEEQRHKNEQKFEILQNGQIRLNEHEVNKSAAVVELKKSQQYSESFNFSNSKKGFIPNTSETRMNTNNNVKNTSEYYDQHIEQQPTRLPEQYNESVIEKSRVTAQNLVFEQSVEAAQQNAAVEKIYERRSEVKDDPTTASSLQRTGSVGGMHAVNQAYQANNVLVHSDSAITEEYNLTDEQRAAAYRSAMNWGFGVAVAIITFAIVAYLMAR